MISWSQLQSRLSNTANLFYLGKKQHTAGSGTSARHCRLEHRHAITAWHTQISLYLTSQIALTLRLRDRHWRSNPGSMINSSSFVESPAGVSPLPVGACCSHTVASEPIKHPRLWHLWLSSHAMDAQSALPPGCPLCPEPQAAAASDAPCAQPACPCEQRDVLPPRDQSLPWLQSSSTWATGCAWHGPSARCWPQGGPTCLAAACQMVVTGVSVHGSCSGSAQRPAQSSVSLAVAKILTGVWSWQSTGIMRIGRYAEAFPGQCPIPQVLLALAHHNPNAFVVCGVRSLHLVLLPWIYVTAFWMNGNVQ